MWKVLTKSFSIEGGAASQALKRAKILDSDNEDEVPEGEGIPKNDNHEVSEGLIDAEGESSDEGVRNDDPDNGCVDDYGMFDKLMNWFNVSHCCPI